MPADAPTAFFSYSREDSAFALRLAADLKAAGANVWLDQLDIIPGQRWARSVETALNSAPRLLVILSPASASSTNVEDEVNFALEERKTIIPVLYRDCKVPFQLRPFQYVDFRADYDRGLAQMLKALGVERRTADSAGTAAIPPQAEPDINAGTEPVPASTPAAEQPASGAVAKVSPEPKITAPPPPPEPAQRSSFVAEQAAAEQARALEEKRAHEEQERAAERQRLQQEERERQAAAQRERELQAEKARQELARQEAERARVQSQVVAPPPKPEPVHVSVPPPPSVHPQQAKPGRSPVVPIVVVVAVIALGIGGYVIFGRKPSPQPAPVQPGATNTQPEQKPEQTPPEQTPPTTPGGNQTANAPSSAAPNAPSSAAPNAASSAEPAEKAPEKTKSRVSKLKPADSAPAALPPGMDASLAGLYHRAQGGDSGAMVDLGYAYRAGKGVPKDDKQGAYWYKKAAEAGNPHGMYDLGVLYERGLGVAQDYQQAVVWYRKAAEAGDRAGMYNLGYLYSHGTGVPLDYTQAVNWYGKAAELGNAQAMTNLGFMYENGYGVPKNALQAVGWYRKSAAAGDATGMNNLANMYEKGIGVQQDQQQAIYWYKKAAALGQDKAIASLKRLGVTP